MSLTVNQISASYRQFPVVERLSFAVDRGRRLVVYGPSGSGKTTLLRLIAGLERLEHGSIAIDGVSVSTVETQIAPRLRNCAMIFQDLALWPHLTVMQHLHFMQPGLPAAEKEQQSCDMLRQVELLEKSRCYPHQLSGGEQQRLAIARALVVAPGLLLLDEPFSSLDFSLRKKMIELLTVLGQKKEMTIVYVTHSLEELMRLADEVLVLDKGKNVFFGSKDQFAATYADQLRESRQWLEGAL